jgi:TRAP-type mannitol/chloroaromatic compound transport system permease small subunit
MPLVKILDKISSWAGAVAAWICIPLTMVVVYEVAMRHLFNMPSKWGYEIGRAHV